MILALLKQHIVRLKMEKLKMKLYFLDAFEEADEFIAQADATILIKKLK